VEGRALEAEALLAGAEGAEVLCWCRGGDGEGRDKVSTLLLNFLLSKPQKNILAFFHQYFVVGGDRVREPQDAGSIHPSIATAVPPPPPTTRVQMEPDLHPTQQEQ
jgi:hypothetical protein